MSKNAERMMLAMAELGREASGFEIAKAAGLDVDEAADAMAELMTRGTVSYTDPDADRNRIVDGSPGCWNN